MPSTDALSITVPGAVDGWRKLNERYGKLSLADSLDPAIKTAHDGYTVERMIAREWATAGRKLKSRQDGSLFLHNGETPSFGTHMTNPSLGGAIERIAYDGGRDFYHGAMAHSMANSAQEHGGVLTFGDITDWVGSKWVAPISGQYRGLTIYQMPPPSQGLVLLQTLGILDQIAFSSCQNDILSAKALGAAMADGIRTIGDPDSHENDPQETLLDESYLREKAQDIMSLRRLDKVLNLDSDTVYVTAVDRDGNACSLIQSIYQNFGSGIMVSDGGFMLQNRGATFATEPGHVNRVGPRKRPFNTTMPAMVLRETEFFASLGVVGCFMQPQGQLQVLQSLVDSGLTASFAVAEPRWRLVNRNHVAVESGFDSTRAARLSEAGFAIGQLKTGDAGGAQVILKRNQSLEGASDWRKDGVVGIT